MPSCGIRLRRAYLDKLGGHESKGHVELRHSSAFVDPRSRWTQVEVDDWYGGGRRRVEVYHEACVWHKSGHQSVVIPWVLVRDPPGGDEPQAFMSTDVSHQPAQILNWFVRRWRMEVTFEEARAHLGIETQRQ